ncbi:hypothetical protein K435DRAFT_808688 [Dendrothele bispora CBS 962.96]|uniref:Myb/SANT-like domain-containing protein n=1 Tax=Dendrothele bispora (strain CBS 962.96) TaxID=1314807 RepID=A0A4S8L0U1_DENBC|nr:hypothetical protein K435DRAFT_808688 [Dendrothele bispora CBS 962.96]
MSRCEWTNSDIDVMIEELKNQKTLGNQAQSGWKSDAWTSVCKRVNSEGSQKGAPKTAKKCQDKFGALKNAYKSLHFICEQRHQGLDGMRKEDGCSNRGMMRSGRLLLFHDDMFALVDGKIATGAKAFHPSETIGTSLPSQSSEMPESQSPEAESQSSPSQIEQTPGAGAPSPIQTSLSNGSSLASISSGLSTQTPAPPSRKRVRAESDSPEPEAYKRRRRQADSLSEVAVALRAIGDGLSATEATPQRRRKAIAQLEKDGEFSPESKRRVLRVFRKHMDIADTFLGITDKETRTGYLLDELNDIDLL